MLTEHWNELEQIHMADYGATNKNDNFTENVMT